MKSDVRKRAWGMDGWPRPRLASAMPRVLAILSLAATIPTVAASPASAVAPNAVRSWRGIETVRGPDM